MWTPIAPCWITDRNSCNFVAIGKTESELKCYSVNLPFINPEFTVVSKEMIQTKDTLENEINKIKNQTLLGKSILSDLNFIITGWMRHLSDPSLETRLIKYINLVGGLARGPDTNVKELMFEINQVSRFIDEKYLAREPKLGEICGKECSSIKIAQYQIEALQVKKTPKPVFTGKAMFKDYHLNVKFGSRLQNQKWRAVIYLRNKNARITQSYVYDFDHEMIEAFPVSFSHVFSSDLFLVVEISAGEENGPQSRIGCGVVPLPLYNHEAVMNIATPFSGHWSNFAERIINGGQSDNCPLISAISVKYTKGTTKEATPSLIQDGFQSYDSMHLQIGKFVADSHQNSAYFLRFRTKGPMKVNQSTSNMLLNNRNSDECFTFSDYSFGDNIKVELWRGKTMVSISSLPQGEKFTISFKSLTTFQSVGITKHIADLHCTAKYMGRGKKPEDIIRVEGYMNYSEVQKLSQLRQLTIDKNSTQYFQSLGSALLSIIGRSDSPQVHEVAFLKLMQLLEYSKEFPYSMKHLLEIENLELRNRHHMLSIILFQIFNFMKSDHDQQDDGIIIRQIAQLGDLIMHLAANFTPESEENLRILSAQIGSGISTLTRKSSMVNAKDNSDTRKQLIKKIPTPVDARSGYEYSKNDLNWRKMQVVNQVSEIVKLMRRMYRKSSETVKLEYLENLETFFKISKSLVGEPSVLLLISFLSDVDWNYEYSDTNTKKLRIMAKIPESWNLDKDSFVVFATICLNSVAPVWVESKHSHKWVDLHQTACIIRYMLENTSSGYINDILNEILPLIFDINANLSEYKGDHMKLNLGGQLNNIFDCEFLEPNYEFVALEFMLLAQEILQIHSNSLVYTLSMLGHKTLRQLAMKIIKAVDTWLEYKTIIPEMYSLTLCQSEAAYNALQYLSKLLRQHFLPLPDEMIEFESDLWYNLFRLLTKMVLSPEIHPPSDPLQAVAHSKLIGSLEQKALLLIENSWRGLQWKTNTEEDTDLFYGYQVSLFCCQNSVTPFFVDLVFSGHKGIEPLLRNIIGTEWIINDNLTDITLELLESLDDMFIRRYECPHESLTPSAAQCAAFTNLFEGQGGAHLEGFIGTIREYLQLLRDNYRYDTLLTVHRMIKFMKRNNAVSLFTRYNGLILRNEKNPRYLGLALLDLASIHHWEDNSMAAPLDYPALPAQRVHQRKEALNEMAIQHFINSGNFVLAIRAIQECQVYYHKVLDYQKLSITSEYLTTLYREVASERNAFPNYYLVAFGEGIGGISGESYVFEQAPSIRLNEFTEEIERKYGPDAQVTVKTVLPVSKRAYDEYIVMPWLVGVLNTHETRQFSNSYPLPHKGISDMKVEKEIFTIEDNFPIICCTSRVIKSTCTRLNSVENAVEVIQSRTEDLHILCSRSSKFSQEDKVSIQLELLLGSTVSSPVNGGLSQYRTLLAQDKSHELSRAFQNLKNTTQLALELYSQIIDPAMRPQYEHFMEMFKTQFGAVDSSG